MAQRKKAVSRKKALVPKSDLISGNIGKGRVNLKTLGEYLGLSPATISLVLNNAPGAKAISAETSARVREAAKKFDYRPSFFARALQGKRTFSIGVLIPQLNDNYCASIMEGVEEVLIEEGYIYLTACHRRSHDLIEEYPRLLMERAVDGFILIDTPPLPSDRWLVPVVAVAGHTPVANVTNIQLDQRRAAELGLQHLYQLGHRKIAFMRGAAYSSDADDRWNSFRTVAEEIGLTIDDRLVITIPLNISSPELGYPATQQLLAGKAPFTAIVAFNDLAAIGALRAIREHGLHVPEDISILGFDDISAAAYQNPALTTIRQPLHDIGRIAAHTLLRRITQKEVGGDISTQIIPELIVRQSTGRVTSRKHEPR